MILQLKYMSKAMYPARNAKVYDAPYLQNEFGDPRFFFTFLI